ncbi:MAG: CPBP family intramembrane glutamic endopeptidase [Chryseotalea sp.]|jgi:membrane protease YdiL (CAAX protease family)|nr:CPBP family intramembrane metalloprotease [Flammeovirgaceae bacterium]
MTSFNSSLRVNKRIVIFSPILIIIVNFAIAFAAKYLIGKWAFIPMILSGWILWLFFILKFGGWESIKVWLQKSEGSFFWPLLSVLIGFIPLPLFIFHYTSLSVWTIWLPWLTIAIVNPWIEEFYWRGLLLDFTKGWSKTMSVLYSSFLFAINHAAFGINSELNSGLEIIISTLFMGVIWSVVYVKTKSLRWTIFAHFLVDFLGLSSAAFLDLWEKGNW